MQEPHASDPNRAAFVLHWLLRHVWVCVISVSILTGLGLLFVTEVLPYDDLAPAIAVACLLALAGLSYLHVGFVMTTHSERQARIRTQAELQGTYDVTPIGLFTLTADGAIMRANPALEQLLGTFTIHIGRAQWKEYFGERAWQRLNLATSHDSPAEVRIQGAPDGPLHQRHFLTKAIRVDTYIEGSLQDVTDQVNTLHQLRVQASHDSLTGALNKRGINDRLKQALQRVALGQRFWLAYLDLNPHRAVSDIYGPVARDRAVKQVCAHINTLLSDTQILGRIDSDEFIILFEHTSTEQARNLSQRILDDLRLTSHQIANHGIQGHSTMGLVEIASALRVQDILSVAARACRMAGKTDSSKVKVYDHASCEIDEHFQELEVLKELGDGLSPDRLFLEMQPVMALRHPRASLNFEVLLRIKNDHGGLISTEKMISAAEENGMVSAIDRWVLRTMLIWLDEHKHSLPHTRFICINLSGMSLNDDAFVADFFVMLGNYKHLATMLCIEITESVALRNMENTHRFIQHLQELGIRVALDDFGAGYTSFSYLVELSADIIKIDGQFIKRMTRCASTAAMVETLVSLGDHLGMETIAESVEDHETLMVLRKMGVDYAQGFAIARSMGPSAILATTDISTIIADDAVRREVQGRF